MSNNTKEFERIDSGEQSEQNLEQHTAMNQIADAATATPADVSETLESAPQTEHAVPLYAAASPSSVQPEKPSGPSVATIVFGIILVFVGLGGLLSALAYDSWMPAFMRLLNVTPQTVMAFGCGLIGVLFIVIALVLAIVKGVKQQ